METLANMGISERLASGTLRTPEGMERAAEVAEEMGRPGGPMVGKASDTAIWWSHELRGRSFVPLLNRLAPPVDMSAPRNLLGGTVDSAFVEYQNPHIYAAHPRLPENHALLRIPDASGEGFREPRDIGWFFDWRDADTGIVGSEYGGVLTADSLKGREARWLCDAYLVLDERDGPEGPFCKLTMPVAEDGSLFVNSAGEVGVLHAHSFNNPFAGGTAGKRAPSHDETLNLLQTLLTPAVFAVSDLNQPEHNNG